jgi:hypothetical protein
MSTSSIFQDSFTGDGVRLDRYPPVVFIVVCDEGNKLLG